MYLKLCGYIYHQGTYTPLWGVRFLYVRAFFQNSENNSVSNDWPNQ